MTKPSIIVDAHWREMSELFSPGDEASLRDLYDVVWGKDAPIPRDVYDAALPKAEVLIAAEPKVDRSMLDAAPRLRAVIEVSGAFPATIDYAACAERKVEVLSCAPGFREAVAEMALGMALAGARGLVAEHENFRKGQEAWLSDQVGRDKTLFDAPVGFVGFGSIGQTIATVLRPFRPDIMAHDPWLPEPKAAEYGARLGTLLEVMAHSRCLFVAAAPSRENAGIVDAAALSRLPDGAQVIVISRAHLVNFEDLLAEVRSGRLLAAIDVFPSEPVAQDDPLRTLPGLILSPHRAAAVQGGRHLIGRLMLSDLAAMFSGEAARGLQQANPDTVFKLAGVGDATQVSTMAAAR